MLFFVVVFWWFMFLLFFAYLGYPMFIYAAATFLHKPVKAGSSLPKLTILIPAYNEGDVLRQKLENTLALDYPQDLLQIIVISDASTDGTNSIAESYAKQGVQLILNQQQRGKTFGLNRAVKIAQGEILIFTDADAFFDKDSIRLLVKGFNDESVGLITGSTRYFSQIEDGSVVLSMGIYTRLERWLKTYESKIGSCVGADGAIFALRKSLYRPLGNTDINDLVIPLNTVRQGYRVIFDPMVFCREGHSTSLADEFNRQIRISNRTVKALLNNRDLLSPMRCGHFSWMLFFHKWLRFLFPIILMLTIILNLVLVFVFSEWAYLMPLVSIALLLMLPFLAKSAEGMLIAVLRSFVMTNIAILIGWKKALRNEVIVTWGDTERSG